MRYFDPKLATTELEQFGTPQQHGNVVRQSFFASHTKGSHARAAMLRQPRQGSQVKAAMLRQPCQGIQVLGQSWHTRAATRHIRAAMCHNGEPCQGSHARAPIPRQSSATLEQPCSYEFYVISSFQNEYHLYTQSSSYSVYGQIESEFSRAGKMNKWPTCSKARIIWSRIAPYTLYVCSSFVPEMVF